MNYPVNPDLMPALMAVFQHVRTRIQSELDCQRLDLTPPDVHVLGIRNFWLIKCQRCKEENLSQRII